jgi:hypothetical protein
MAQEALEQLVLGKPAWKPSDAARAVCRAIIAMMKPAAAKALV